jgi:hypothetical protein
MHLPTVAAPKPVCGPYVAALAFENNLPIESTPPPDKYGSRLQLFYLQ